jgi:hypothetical protein
VREDALVMKRKRRAAALGALGLLLPLLAARGEERRESFDRDPLWDGHQNRPGARTEEVRQDFGYSPGSRHAGGGPGEVGGRVQMAAEPAYYAKVLPPATLGDALSASGTLLVAKGRAHFQLGFFNEATINEWRTPNTLVLRVLGRGDFFYAYVDYATARWRAGGVAFAEEPAAGKKSAELKIPSDVPHAWSLRYDPAGSGVLAATLDGRTVTCPLEPDHRADGASFNRFGVLAVSKSWSRAGEFWLDGLTVQGVREDLRKDPGWEGRGNRKSFRTTNIRPQFDFGFSPTGHAGGAGAGELGGLIFRGDCRYPERLAAYGDRLSAELTLTRPLKAAGSVCLRRGVSDSTSLIGFYHSRSSLLVNDSQAHATPMDFLGIAVEGPSSEGFLFYPLYRVHGEGEGHAGRKARPPHILPDGKPHHWTLDYDPGAPGGKGLIAVQLDGQPVRLELEPGHQALGTRFDRFGLVTTWIDGNGQELYFDDLTYTVRQDG